MIKINSEVFKHSDKESLSINEDIAINARLVQSASRPISKDEIQFIEFDTRIVKKEIVQLRIGIAPVSFPIRRLDFFYMIKPTLQMTNHSLPVGKPGKL